MYSSVFKITDFKRIVSLIILLVGVFSAKAQVNTFPNVGNVGIGTNSPTNLLNINLGPGTTNGTVALKIGATDNYPSLEFGIENSYDAQIRTFGNDLKIYSGHFREKGTVSTENHAIYFFTSKKGSADWSTPKVVLDCDGFLGIGTTTPNERLSVNGKIRAHEIKVETANWPDYVFEPDYKLKPLSELSSFIKENGHLPDVPKAAVVEAEGVSLGEMNKILLKKVEELTLYIIDLQKQVTVLQREKRTDAL